MRMNIDEFDALLQRHLAPNSRLDFSKYGVNRFALVVSFARVD
jgi:hypothetical protein